MVFFELFTQTGTYISLATLTFMEIVLGIDNIIFISIVTGKLPDEIQEKARVVGLTLAVLFRIILLLCIVWIAGLVEPLFTIFNFDVTGRDIVLIGGGLFLITKSTLEIHTKIEGGEVAEEKRRATTRFATVIMHIIMLDIVFSFDSVITAVGLVKHIAIMIIAILLSLVVMIAFAKKVSHFINKNPTITMLALAFLLMIGLLLFAEGFHIEVPKGYVYFAMAFSIFVEMLNMKLRKKAKSRVLKDQ
ncbi:TerC family protein [Bacteroidota bacterium]